MDTKLYWYRGIVTHIVHGDTVDVEIDLGMRMFTKQRLRLYGVDTPEIFGVDKESEEYAHGMQAKLFVEQRLLNRTVWIHTHKDKTEKYGRYLAEIFIQDDDGVHVSIGKLLLEDGLAEEYKGN